MRKISVLVAIIAAFFLGSFVGQPRSNAAAPRASVEQQIRQLKSRVSDLEYQLYDVEDLSYRIDDLESTISGVTDCVNEYMKVVADARGGAYRFYYC